MNTKERQPKSITGPIKVERHDLESGLIAYEVWDTGAETYHRICTIYEGDNDHAKVEAEFVAMSLSNTLGAFKAIAAMERQ